MGGFCIEILTSTCLQERGSSRSPHSWIVTFVGAEGQLSLLARRHLCGDPAATWLLHRTLLYLPGFEGI